MPRRTRIATPGVPLHLIQRGNNRGACFFAEEDYARYLEHLGELSEKFGCAVHAYVLMSNHVHLLLTPARADSASLLMKHLGQRYVQYINRSYRRSGTLWEGRFRSCIAQAENYVLACYRYIELNPVRARMVDHPREYRWSSYRANAEGVRSKVVVSQAQYLALGRSAEQRREAYRELFGSHLDFEIVREIREATNGNYALGSERFRREVEVMIGRRVSRGNPGRPRSGNGGRGREFDASA
ncbi:MAG: transposase [Rhodocyclales bacterium]|nr:transposase [Rhodocyclales bacterium]